MGFFDDDDYNDSLEKVKIKSYSQYYREGNSFYPTPNISVLSPLPPGVYKFAFDSRQQKGWFDLIDTNYDKIVDLPSDEFVESTSQIKHFLKEETKNKYKQYGFLYKRSILFHGKPGTGKTILVNRLAEMVIKCGGVVLFNPSPDTLPIAFNYLNDIQPDLLCMVIFEELDQILEGNEGELLNILDGEIQKSNVIYVATTNFIDSVPARIVRPGRFSDVIEVKYPSTEARKVFLDKKLSEEDKKKHNIDEWVKITDGLSIDELKEVVLSVCCLDKKVNKIVSKIKETKELSDGMIESVKRRKVRDL